MENSFLLKLLKPVASLSSGLGTQKKHLTLIYHRVLDRPDFMRPGEIDIAAFTWQMELISKHFNVLPLKDAIKGIETDTLPTRAVSITFDDGYADNYTNALPILNHFNLKATFFIASGFLNGGRMWNDTIIEAIRNLPTSSIDLTKIGLGRFNVRDEAQKSHAAHQIIQQVKHLPFEERNHYTDYIAKLSSNLPNDLMMTDEQIKCLHRNGMEIGGHTVNHPILAKLDNNNAENEITANKYYLESLLKTPISIFAYPNGKPNSDYLPDQVGLVKKAGYMAAVSTQWGVSTRSTDRWQLCRFTPWDNNSIKFMLRIIFNYHH